MSVATEERPAQAAEWESKPHRYLMTYQQVWFAMGKFNLALIHDNIGLDKPMDPSILNDEVLKMRGRRGGQNIQLVGFSKYA